MELVTLETAVGRARAGRHRTGWQDANRSDTRRYREDLQRRQHARGRPDRVRSALTQEVKIIEARKGYVHAALVKIKSGQLPFLGL
jgi:hypothetical protein